MTNTKARGTGSAKVDFFVWQFKHVPNACVLDELIGVEKKYQITKGIPRAATFSGNAAFTMDPDFPNDTLLVDAFETTKKMTVISPRLKAFLEEQTLKNVEFLPITIINHKKRPAAQYFVLHPIHPVDCLDMKESDVKWDPIDDSQIYEVTRMVLDVSRMDPEIQLFKIKYFYDFVIVRQDLVEAIKAQNFTGIKWTELSDFRR
jgi:hypothetical protein